MSEWDVPGYDAAELLGFGTSGEVWRARERSSGDMVALRRLVGGDREAVAAIRTTATVVRVLPSEHLVRLRTTSRVGRDDVLVLDYAASGSLAALLARRGHFSPGEVVTAVAPIAEALGQAHSHGLVHGRVRASSVLLTADGKPLLDGLGLTCLYDADNTLDAIGSTDDVRALGALAHLLLTGTEPGTESVAMLAETLAATSPLPLGRAIQAALALDPLTRPSAGALASSLLVSCPAMPLSGVVAAQLPTLAPSGFSMPRAVRRRVLLAAVAAVAVVAVMALGSAWGARTGPEAATVRPASPVSATEATTDWRAVLQKLDGARADAFAHADASRLVHVYPAASPILAANTRVLSGLSRLRRTAVGVEHVVRSLTPLRVTQDRAEFEVVEALAACEVQDASGRVLERQTAGPDTTHLVVLVRAPAGWRVEEIRLRA